MYVIYIIHIHIYTWYKTYSLVLFLFIRECSVFFVNREREKERERKREQHILKVK